MGGGAEAGLIVVIQGQGVPMIRREGGWGVFQITSGFEGSKKVWETTRLEIAWLRVALSLYIISLSIL